MQAMDSNLHPFHFWTFTMRRIGPLTELNLFLVFTKTNRSDDLMLKPSLNMDCVYNLHHDRAV